MKVLTLLILMGFLISLPTAARATIDKDLVEQLILDPARSATESIYNNSANKLPNGNIGWFYGDRPVYWHWNRYPNNIADRNFGQTLYHVYKGYCNLLNRNNNCLGKNIKIMFRIRSQEFGNGTYFFRVNQRRNGEWVNIGQASTRSILQLQGKLFMTLENTWGRVPRSGFVRKVLTKRGIPVNFFIARGRIRDAQTVKWGKTIGEWDRLVQDRWRYNEEFKQAIIDAANEMVNDRFTKSDIYFYINSVQDYANPRVYNAGMYRFFSQNRNRVAELSPRGVNILIHRLNSDFWGFTSISHLRNPVIVIRSKYFSDNIDGSQYYFTNKAIGHNARLILHELGHGVLRLGHGNWQDNPRDNNGNVIHTGNWSKTKHNQNWANARQYFGRVAHGYEY